MKLYLIGLLTLISTTVWAQKTTAISQAMDNYNYKTAIELIEKEQPTAELLYLKAKAYKGLYKYNEAAMTLQTIVTQLPDNQQILLELGECSKLAGKFNESLKYYEDFLKLNPEHTYAQTQYINLLFMLDKYRQAKKACEEALAVDSSTIYLKLMAQCNEGLLEPLSARDCYEKVIIREPEDFFSVSKLAGIYIQTDDVPKAIDLTEEFRKRDSTNIYVNRQNAQAYCLLGEYDKAIERYEKILSLGDSTRLTTYYAGMSYFAKEFYFEAHDCLEVALKYDPKNVNILYYLGRACAKTSWKEKGVEYMKMALEYTIPTDENLGKLYAGLAECYQRNREWKNYVSTMLTQRKYEPNKHALLYRIGAAYQDLLKDDKNAERYLEMYLKTKPQDLDESVTMEGNTIVVDDKTTYKVAERRLSDIRKERFFKEGIKEE